MLRIKKFISQYFFSLGFSFLGFIFFTVILYLLKYAGLEIEMFGDKSNVLFGYVFGFSIGGVIGLVFADRNTRKQLWLFLIACIISLLCGFSSIILGAFLLDTVGASIIFLIPLLTSLMCLVGYNLALLIGVCLEVMKKRNK